MVVAARLLVPVLLALPVLAWPQGQQRQPLPEPLAGKAGSDYVILNSSVINYSSIGPTNATAETYSAGLALGTYISDFFKVEIRIGGGFSEDSASYAAPPRQDGTASEPFILDVSMPYYASWYMGLLYPWSNFSSIYGQFGFSHVKGEAETATPQRFEDITDKLYGSSFSASWLLGLDFELTDRAYLLIEGGRLHTDTETNINTMQYTLGLRYEF